MNLLRLLIVPLFAAALLFSTSSLYSAPVVTAQQKTRSAHSKKPADEFYFVCPMHDTVTSKELGTCPKCKMKLVKKSLPQK